MIISVDQFLRLSGVVIATGGVVYGIRLIWTYFVYPIYRALISLAEFMEAQPTLLTIAHEFEPNDGNTLRDQMDSANIRLGNIEGQLEFLVQSHGPWDGITERRNET